MSTIAAQILDDLVLRGVTAVFGLPGNHNLPFYRALAATELVHYTARHEQGAAFMADGYARASGTPGVCLLIGGPGLTNAATAIAQAYADSVPMLILTPVTLSDPAVNGRLHELPDQGALAASICRESYTIGDASEVAHVMARCFHRFEAQRPGPVHIQVTLEALTAESVTATPGASTPQKRPDGQHIEAAAALLNTAHSPMILAGGGAKDAGASLMAFAERWDAPVLNTVNAKGVMPSSHPLTVGASPSLPSVVRALGRADIVLAVGTELGETDYDLLMTGRLMLPGKLVRIDIDPGQLTRNAEPAMAIAGDARVVLEELAKSLSAQPREGVERARLLRESITTEPHNHPEMARVFDTFQKAIPDAVVVGDSTLPTYYAAWMWETQRPRSYFHSVSGFGTLGYAIPAAIGAKIAQPQRPVLGIVGDGGAQFTLAELRVAVQYELAVVFVLWNNDGYSEIQQSMKAQGIPTMSAEVAPPDYEAVARAMGCGYAKPDSHDELAKCLTAAANASGPSVVEVRQERFIHEPSGQWYQ